MSIDMILLQIREFLSISLPYCLIAATLSFIIFKVGFRRKDYPVWKLIPVFLLMLSTVFIIHLTCLTRSEAYGTMDLHLFRSYYEAWNTFSIRNWQLIIFNILMFCPFGFLLPMVSRHCRNILITTGIGGVFSLVIELTQYVTHRGLCEVDDLFHNTLGALLGYCIFRIVYTVSHKKERWRFLRIVMAALPILLVCSMFFQIFYRYVHQPYGNLPVSFTYRMDLSDTDFSISSNLHLKKEASTEPVFQSVPYSRQDARLFASDLLDRMQIEGTTRYSDYEDIILCYRGDHSVSVSLKNRSYEYHRLDTENPVWENIGSSAILYQLSQWGIEIPTEAELTRPSTGSYTWTISRTRDTVAAGSLTCVTTSDGSIYSIINQIIPQEIYSKEAVISEAEAYERLCDGYFQIYPHNYEIRSIHTYGVELTYSQDTKGFYQPVYLFHCKINGENVDLVIPALKKS